MMEKHIKKWIVNPIFGTASSGHHDKRGKGPRSRPSGGDGGVDAISKRERAADYAQKNEEDAVEDYNAPM